MHFLRQANILFWILAGAILLAGCHSSKQTASRQPTSTPPVHLSKSDLKDIHPATAKLLTEADSWIGTPYRFAGTDRNGIDCSALTVNVFRKALAIALPRNSAAQAEACTPVKRSDLIAGDLVFFSSNNSGKGIGHVGIYVGDGRFIHASSSQGVVISSLDGKWFDRHYRRGGRVEAYYAMLESPQKSKSKSKRSRKKDKKPESPLLPDPEENIIAATDGKTITLEQFVASSRQKSEPAVVTATAPPKAAVPTKPSPPPAPELTVKIASVNTSASGVSASEARARVINTFKELPPDSVMTSFFE